MPATKSTIGLALAVTCSLMLTSMMGPAFARGPIYDPVPRPIPRPTATNANKGVTAGGVQRPDRNRRLN